MNPSLFLMVSLVGGVVSVVSLFLPWVQARFIGMVLPIVGPLLGLVNQELKNLVEQFSAISSITGYQAVFTLKIIGPDLPILVLLPTAVGMLAIAGSLVGMLWPQSIRLVSILLAVAGVIVFVVLVFNIPNIGRLGYGDNWMAATALSLLGFAPAMGFWGTLIGVLLIGVGAGCTLFLSANTRSKQEEDFF